MDTKPLNRFERRKQRTQKKLEEAAIQLILEKGFEAVAIQDITDRADLGRATFYLHYKDKDDLVWDFINKELENFFDKVQTLGEENHGAKSSTYYSLLLDFQLLDQNRDLYKIVLGDVGPKRVRKRVKEMTISDIEKSIREGRFYQTLDLPPTIIAQFVAGALHQLFQWWLETPNDYTPEQMVDMIFLMLDSLL